MSANERSSDAYLTLLEQQGEEINFFQAVRLLEQALAPDPELRFKVMNSDAFYPNFVASIKKKKVAHNKHSATVSVHGFGVTGMQGPIPQCFTEMLQRAEIKGEKGSEDPNAFLDIFHDRILNLLYDIKKQFNPMLFNEQPEDHSIYTLFSNISGFNFLNLFEHLPIKKAQLSSFAPVMANRRVDYSLIINVLKNFLKLDVKLIPNQGAWRELPDDVQAKLSSDKSSLSSLQSMGLGKGVGLGNRYWDNQAAIKLQIKVNSIEGCHQLLPKGGKHSELCSLITFLTDGKYHIYVELFINWKDIPVTKLSTKAQLKLGQTSWLNDGRTADCRVTTDDPVILGQNSALKAGHLHTTGIRQSRFEITPSLQHSPTACRKNEVAA
jgi:type VI secretion system protein ImpH